MTTSYSMVIGGALLTLGIISILISWLFLRTVSQVTEGAAAYLSLFVLGLVCCTIGVFFLLFRRIRESQI
ncbi:MAG: hypothetical protein JRN15_03905 [Nitrososphaerota archaeon]|nr:hypothetical protein [Nitrososphaerota archaeon]